MGEGKLRTLLPGLKPTPYKKTKRAAGLHKGGKSGTYLHHLKNIIMHLKSGKSDRKPTRALFSSCG